MKTTYTNITRETSSKAALMPVTKSVATNLVTVTGGKPTTTTLAIALGIGNEHKAVIQLVRKYQNDLREFGTLTFEMAKSRGQSTEFAILNEQQTTLIMTYMKNTPIIRTFKKKLVKEFYRMAHKLLRRQSSAEFLEARQQGKLVRRAETDAIAEFVPYSLAQGSKNAPRYYSLITQMIYRTLGQFGAVNTPIRDFLGAAQASALALAENIVAEALRDGMAQGLYYRDVYILAKIRVTSFASALPTSLMLPTRGEAA